MVDPTDGDGPKNRFRINSVEITNYKAIDHLKLEFPEPLLPDDPDVFVIGSRNGVGKTSVLEACALTLYFNLAINLKLSPDNDTWSPEHELSDKVIRRGSDQMNANIVITNNNSIIDFKFSVSRDGQIKKHRTQGARLMRRIIPGSWESIWTITSYNQKSLFSKSFAFLPSYRRVEPGRMPLEWVLTENTGIRRISKSAVPEMLSSDQFKRQVAKILLQKSSLLELENTDSAQVALEVLNRIMMRFSAGRIEQFRQVGPSHLDLRVTPDDGGGSYSFDSLSSGQREIISTTFLIWMYTKNLPRVVFIDEPELHLNAEWHKPFIHELTRLAPWNQYILATHSPDVFAAVQPRHRVILRPNTNEAESFERAAGDA